MTTQELTPHRTTRNARPKRFSEYDQDELRNAMLRSLRGHAEPQESATQVEVYWTDIKRMLRKHGRLTTGDIATLSGRSVPTTKAFMRRQQWNGKVIGKVIHGKGAVEWVLT